jgi:hypothetical protein
MVFIQYPPCLSRNTIVPDGAQVGCIVLDAVGTAGGSGTAFIKTIAGDVVTQLYPNTERIRYNHSKLSLKTYSKLDKLFHLNYIRLLIAW